MTGTGGLQRIPRDFISNFQIPLPPLSIQQQIVDKIENYQAITNGAKQVVQNYKPQIDIDPDWESVKLGNFIIIDNGNVLTEFVDNGNLACIKVSDMNLPENQISITTSSHWTNISMKKLLPIDSIIFPKRGAAIATNKKRITKIPCVIDNNCMGLTIIDKEKLLPEFLFYFFLNFDLASISNSAGIALINNPDIRGIDISLPSISIQQEIVNRIEQEQQLVNANKELIKIYEQKIKDEINKLWKPAVKQYEVEEERVGVAAEG